MEKEDKVVQVQEQNSSRPQQVWSLEAKLARRLPHWYCLAKGRVAKCAMPSPTPSPSPAIAFVYIVYCFILVLNWCGLGMKFMYLFYINMYALFFYSSS